METNAPLAQFLLAAPHSGAGKTTVTLGLLRALRNRGLGVQPFKCGPDFIDPLHHTTAAGRPSINLDQYMMSPDHIRQLYHRYTTDADVAITEGVMGLFDGSVKREGSSADMAALLQLPVILILNAKAMAYSAAALLYGLRNFDPALRIAGVIFNFVNTDTHYRLLREAAEDAGVTALGHLPVNNELHIPSRHLGLDTADAGAAIAAAARHIEAHLDLDAILAATRSARTSTSPIQPGNPRTNAIPSLPPSEAVGSPRGDKTIFVARDAAFHFLYRENLRMLERYGSIRFFSPLSDPHLPGKGNLLYLPGGYPELYLEQLSANTSLLRDIRAFAGNGGRILAECGGMMFLGHSITDEAGKAWPAVGLLDLGTTIKEKRLSLGYRTLTLDGQGLKGHEFHYSQFTAPPADPNPNITVCNARGQEVPAPVFYQRNLFASYMHFYWGESTGPLESWLAS